MHVTNEDFLKDFDRIIDLYSKGELSATDLRLFRVELRDHLAITDKIYHDRFNQRRQAREQIEAITKNIKSKAQEAKELKAKLKAIAETLQ